METSPEEKRMTREQLAEAIHDMSDEDLDLFIIEANEIRNYGNDMFEAGIIERHIRREEEVFRPSRRYED